MPNDPKKLEPPLTEVVRKRIPGATGISDLRRLTGGASQQIWSFDAITEHGPVGLVLRRAFGKGPVKAAPMHVNLEGEARMLGVAGRAGVPVPVVHHVLQPDEGCGYGFIMDRIEGETIARRILREDAYAEVRPKLARQCGEIAARMLSVPAADISELSLMPAAPQLKQYLDNYKACDYPHPVFELAFRWLEERTPNAPEPTLVHGDYRHGNFVIGPDGIRAVLDWEITHRGDPMEDLGWMCVNSWRYGAIDKPVGGFGEREDLFAGYEAGGGGTVDPKRVKYWEVFGSLKWGIMCMTFYNGFINGPDRSVERAAIPRRSSETEIDLLRLLREEF